MVPVSVVVKIPYWNPSYIEFFLVFRVILASSPGFVQRLWYCPSIPQLEHTTPVWYFWILRHMVILPTASFMFLSLVATVLWSIVPLLSRKINSHVFFFVTLWRTVPLAWDINSLIALKLPLFISNNLFVEFPRIYLPLCGFPLMSRCCLRRHTFRHRVSWNRMEFFGEPFLL